MTRVILTPRAQKDLSDIWDYTTENWGIRQAELYIREIQAAIETLAAHPGLGKPCDHIRKGYCKHPARSHIIFYRKAEDAINVVRILHGRMDFERHLK
jgi:toxin ParE1/3/4